MDREGQEIFPAQYPKLVSVHVKKNREHNRVQQEPWREYERNKARVWHLFFKTKVPFSLSMMSHFIVFKDT